VTVTRLLNATKVVFLSRGYDGTSVDEITREAGVARATFYTYFPSKRDALIALAQEARASASAMISTLQALPPEPTVDDLHGFVRRFFETLDEVGSFAIAWNQASRHDDELRAIGVEAMLTFSARIGHSLGKLRGRPFDDPTAQGFLLQGQIERAWSFCLLVDDPALTAAIQRELAANLAAILAHR
jgi:TetR/AcrR family transcriptional regulator